MYPDILYNIQYRSDSSVLLNGIPERVPNIHINSITAIAMESLLSSVALYEDEEEYNNNKEKYECAPVNTLENYRA